MDQIFPYANVVAGVLVLVIGFGIRFGAQLVSAIDWDLGTKLGLQEKGMRPEHKNYPDDSGGQLADDRSVGARCVASGPVPGAPR